LKALTVETPTERVNNNNFISITLIQYLYMFNMQCITVYDNLVREESKWKYRLIDTTTETRHQAENSRVDRSNTTQLILEKWHMPVR